MTIEQNKAVVLRFNREFLEKGNADVLKEIVHERFVNHTAASGVPNDVNGMIQLVKMIHEGFSDVRIDIHEQVGEGDMVATRKTIHAVHTGTIMGHAATGKKVEMNVMDFVRLADGKYVDHWGRNDIMQVISQL